MPGAGKNQCFKCKGYGHLSCQCQKARKETIVEENMEFCQKEAAMIPNSSPKEAMVLEQVTEKQWRQKPETKTLRTQRWIHQ
jgi:hypothetical protein